MLATTARRPWIALLLAAALVVGVTTAVRAADPSEGTVSQAAPSLTWAGQSYTAASSDVDGPCESAAMDPDDQTCDHFTLTVDTTAEYAAAHPGGVEVAISWPLPSDDFDLAVYRGSTEVATSAQGGTTSESVTLPAGPATYEVRVTPFLVTDSAYSGSATLDTTAADPGTGQLPEPKDTIDDYFFQGQQGANDQLNKTNGNPSATFSTDPADGIGSVQQFSNVASDDVPGDPASVYWVGDFPAGTYDLTLTLETYLQSGAAAQGALLSAVTVDVFADPVLDGSPQPAKRIGQVVDVPVTIGPTPTKNLTSVPIEGRVKGRLLIQLTPQFVNENGANVLYDSPDYPSGFRLKAPTNLTPDGQDGLSAVDDGGLEFSATVPADNQRDESEPIVDVAPDGTTYGCGPSGAGTFEFSQVSLDGGDQFHLLGQQPVGAQTAGGGGDCQIALDQEENADGFHDYAYVGLGPLTSFAVATSPDNGQTITRSNVENGLTIPGVDRQWGAFVRPDEVLLSYNQQAPRQIVVQKSNDGGATYGARVPASQQNPSFPGPMRSLPARFNTDKGADAPRVAYFPWNDGRNINFAVSWDGGLNWNNCKVAESIGDPTLFVTADHDSAGRIYVAYGEDTTFHTYMTSLPVGKLDKCNTPITETSAPPPASNPGWSIPVQVDRGDIRTTVFPWITAGSDLEGAEPGNVAVTFYGTESDGNPNEGSFKATWDVYVNQSFDADSTGKDDPPPTFSQTKATTHPFHYDSICLEGLNCSITGGDRSLADFFAIDFNPMTGELVSVYDQGSKAPDDGAGQVATPAAIRQIAGPSLDGGTINDSSRVPVRTSSDDPPEDGIANYSQLTGDPSLRQNEPALDFLGVEVGPEIDLDTGRPVPDGGFTVTMELGDLSEGMLNQALTTTKGQSLLWVWRFVDGYRASAASARYDGSQFTFGYNEYTTNRNNECGTNGKCIQYPGGNEIQGVVDEDAGTITLSVPREVLSALEQGASGPKQRPEELPATDGTRFYDGTAFALVNSMSSDQETQGYMQPVDNTPAFDFLLGAEPDGEDQGPSISIGDLAADEGDEGTTTFGFPMSLSEAQTSTVTVDYATTGGSATSGEDFQAESATVTFPPGSTSATAGVLVNGDTDVEPAETFTVTLSNPQGGTIEDGEGLGTIRNDDDDGAGTGTARLSVDDVTRLEGTGDDTTTFSVPVRLSKETTTAVTVRFATVDQSAIDPDDYESASGMLTFAPGDRVETVTVEVKRDRLAEDDETFLVRLSDPMDAEIRKNDGVQTIRNDDVRPTVSIGDDETEEGDAGTTALTFDVTLSEASGEEISVRARTSDGSATVDDDDYAKADVEVTFEPGDTEKTVTVQVRGDTKVEPDERFAVRLSDRENVRPGRTEAFGTIVNDDTAPPPGGDDGDGDSGGSTATASPSPTASATASPTASPSASPGPVDRDDTVSRLSGAGRIQTAVRLSQEAFPDGAEVAVLARADKFPDALAAAPLASEVEGPVLLTGTDFLDADTGAELDRLGVSRVYLAGGTAALAQRVADDVTARQIAPERLGGANRFATAGLIGDEVVDEGGPVSQVILARGDAFPDALAAGALAMAGRAPILLVATDDVPDATGAALDRLLDAGQTAYIAGGTAAIDVSVAADAAARGLNVQRRSGPTRFGTAVALVNEAIEQGAGVEPTILASGFDFPDALTAGPAAQALGGSLILVDPAGLDRSPETRDYLAANAEEIDTVFIAGGTAAVDESVDAAVRTLIADG